MQTVGTALRNAINAGNPQRILLIFSDREISNEGIVVSNGFELSEEFNSEEDIAIGLTPSSYVTFTLLNDEDQLEDFEFGWFSAYIGARTSDSTVAQGEIRRQFTEGGSTVYYTFSPLGIFYASKPKIIKKKTISVTAYDQMAYLDVNMVSSETMALVYPTTLGAYFARLCTVMNISTYEDSFLNYDMEITKEPADISDATVRQVISWIAECACSIARFNRYGNLEFAWFNTTQEEYDEHNYSAFSPAWYETNAINGLYCRDTGAVTENINGSTLTNNYLIQDNPFLREVTE